jgi:hypothetical protein
MSVAERALTTPSIVVNNEAIAIVPDSFKYTPGVGEINMRAQSGGGGNVQMVKSINAETKKSTAKFALMPTKKNIDYIDVWQDNGRGDGNGIEASDGPFAVAFRNMYVTNDPERNLSSDGTIEIEFEGSPIIG